MYHGTIHCECGKVFYFESARDHVSCINCGKVHKVSDYPQKVEKVEIEEGEIIDS